MAVALQHQRGRKPAHAGSEYDDPPHHPGGNSPEKPAIRFSRLQDTTMPHAASLAIPDDDTQRNFVHSVFGTPSGQLAGNRRDRFPDLPLAIRSA
jgi:hypothetical protein